MKKAIQMAKVGAVAGAVLLLTGCQGNSADDFKQLIKAIDTVVQTTETESETAAETESETASETETAVASETETAEQTGTETSAEPSEWENADVPEEFEDIPEDQGYGDPGINMWDDGSGGAEEMSYE